MCMWKPLGDPNLIRPDQETPAKFEAVPAIAPEPHVKFITL